MNISVILPVEKSDYLANTILDGLIDLSIDGSGLNFIVTKKYPSPFDLVKYEKEEVDFINFAKKSDVIILLWGKNSTNFLLAEKINEWHKTVFIDGSELGKNNRFDKKITQEVLDCTYGGIGAINNEMLAKCKLYFRREKPYIKGIIPLPFGIETRYREFVNKDNLNSLKRDIDFTCIFGQDEYPILRRQVRKYIEEFCKENNFTYNTNKTKGFNFDDNSKKAGRDDFYKILSRTKVGISIGGGGFDTARFWEILASGAILMTEKIDVYNKDDGRLKYKRVIEFNDLDDFKLKIKNIGDYLTNNYSDDISDLNLEYNKVIKDHSASARVSEIIDLYNKTSNE